MTLRPAIEDLGASLQAISGMLGKLGYLSDLRRPTDSYLHWGLARVHGDVAAQQALVEAHRSIVSQILCTPLRNLLQDAEVSGRAQGLTQSAYLQNLGNRMPHLLPPNPVVASARHLSSVLHALWNLASVPSRTPPEAIPPA